MLPFPAPWGAPESNGNRLAAVETASVRTPALVAVQRTQDAPDGPEPVQITRHPTRCADPDQGRVAAAARHQEPSPGPGPAEVIGAFFERAPDSRRSLAPGTERPVHEEMAHSPIPGHDVPHSPARPEPAAAGRDRRPDAGVVGAG